MLPLETLVRQAEAEVARQMEICNACRFCEGFCAVFPAMTRRLEFPKADVHYLANLCHNCGACLHSCQYAAPNPFAVNVPQAMAQLRRTTYAEYAWPAPLGQLYQRNGLTLALALVAALTLFLVLGLQTQDTLWRQIPLQAGSFYAIFPHNLMVSLFAPVFLFSCTALGLGLTRFWRDIDAGTAHREAFQEASMNVLRLKYLDGGHGEGCVEADDGYTHARRHFHHATFYGFLLCFASTSVATLYHYGLGWPAPYGWSSLPKLLGLAGGIGLVLGTAGLGWLNLHRHPDHGETSNKPMDRGFIALLFLVAASGLGLAILRESPALPAMLCLHLASVMAFFATMPYGKFAHGFFRAAALLKWSIERRQPTRLKLTAD
jgi:citrate/tricarballylate utilization protein